MTTPRLRPVDAAVLLKDRVLLLGTDDARILAVDVDDSIGGIVAVGLSARETIRGLEQVMPDMVLIEQPSTHVDCVATPDAPFPFAAVDTDQNYLFADERTLADYLDAQIGDGASLAMFPTGFIRAGDHATMTAIIKTANSLVRSDAILHLPLSYKWLSSAADRTKLIAAAKRSKHPVAISMAHRSDPASQAGVVAGTHALLAETDNVALWHADLGALDALVHGALCAAVGTSSTYRHIVEPGERAFSPSKGADKTPNVLLHEPLRYKRAQAMTRDWFANGGEPTCTCAVCRGRPLNRFGESEAGVREAHRHNLHQLTALHRELLAARHRDLWWAERLADVQVAHERLAAATGVMTIKPDGALKQWIALNPLPGQLGA